jgi:hypothetical protein
MMKHGSYWIQGTSMSHSNYPIKNCSAKAGEYACPKQWGELKPAFSDMARHCVTGDR